MLFAESALNGYAIEAIDGRLGNVRDMLFDDRTWKMRWLVVDTGDWLSGRKVLIHPSAILNADHERQALVINLAKVQVEQSPELNSDQPVSHQMETRIFDHYQWDPYWGSGSFTMGAMAAPLSAPPYFGVSLADGEGWRTGIASGRRRSAFAKRRRRIEVSCARNRRRNRPCREFPD